MKGKGKKGKGEEGRELSWIVKMKMWQTYIR